MAMEEVGSKLILQGQDTFISGMKKAEDASSGFGRTLSKVADGIAQGFGQGLFNMVSSGIGQIPKMLEGVISKTMEWGQSLDDIGDVLGTTTGQSAGLAVMFKTIGGDAGQLTSAVALMTKGLQNVDGSIGPTGKALAALGINFKDANGQILPATDLFQQVADVVGVMPDGLEKTSLMMDIFGKSGKEMGDALAAAANGGMDKYIKQAKIMGLAIDPQQVIESKKSWETLQLVFMGLAVQLGTALLPAIQKIIQWVTTLAQDPAVQAWVQGFIAGIGTVTAWVQEQLPMITATFQGVSDFISGVMTGLQNIINGALSAIQGWWAENGAAISASVQTMWGGVQNEIQAILTFIQTLVSFVLANIQAFWQAHGDTILGIVNWLWNAVQVVFNTATGIITNIFQAFTSLLQGDWGGFLDKLLAAWDLLWGLIRGVAEDAWSKLSTWFSGIIDQIISFFANTDWGQVGRNIIDGIWNGLKNGWNWLIDQIKALAARLLAAALAALGINTGGGGNNNPPGGGPNNNGNGPGGAQYNGFGAQNNVQGLFGGAQMMGAGPNVNNYNTAYNYNLNLTTQQTSQGVQQSFAIMQMMG